VSGWVREAREGGREERGDLPVRSKTCFAWPAGHDRDTYGHVVGIMPVFVCVCVWRWVVLGEGGVMNAPSVSGWILTNFDAPLALLRPYHPIAAKQCLRLLSFTHLQLF